MFDDTFLSIHEEQKNGLVGLQREIIRRNAYLISNI